MLWATLEKNYSHILMIYILVNKLNIYGEKDNSMSLIVLEY